MARIQPGESPGARLVEPKVKRLLDTANRISQPVRIGINVGSSIGAELKPIYPAANLIPASTLQQAEQMLASGDLDGFVTNKAILFELADQVDGPHVLPDPWGLENFALGIPLSRTAGARLLGPLRPHGAVQ